MCKRPRDFFIKKCKLAFGQILRLTALFAQKSQKIAFQALRTTLFYKKMQKNLLVSKKSANFVRFLARNPEKAEK